MLRGEGRGPDGFPLGSLLLGLGRGQRCQKVLSEVRGGVGTSTVPRACPTGAGLWPPSLRSLSKDTMLRPSLGSVWGLGSQQGQPCST